MKRYTPAPIAEETVALLPNLIALGATQEEVIAKMREVGIWQGRSIGLLVQLTGISHGDAKLAVHYSQTWADCRESNDALHDAAFAAAKELGFEEVDADATQEERPALQSAR